MFVRIVIIIYQENRGIKLNDKNKGGEKQMVKIIKKTKVKNWADKRHLYKKVYVKGEGWVYVRA